MDIGAVALSSSAGTAGDNITLTCSVSITSDSSPEESDIIFEWFFGSDNSSLPSNVTVSRVTKSDTTYSSSLQFFPLSLSHTGMYTCRLWNYMIHAASAKVTVFCKLCCIKGS